MRYTIATLSKTNITSNGYREGTRYVVETAYGLPQTGCWDLIGFEFANDDEAYEFATSVVKRIANFLDVACPCIDYLYD